MSIASIAVLELQNKQARNLAVSLNRAPYPLAGAVHAARFPARDDSMSPISVLYITRWRFFSVTHKVGKEITHSG
jgi:hypothetical protein